MNKKICCIGFIFCMILGSAAHFFFEWFGQNPIIGLFAPVNESIWEHLKLVFFPMILYFIIVNTILELKSKPLAKFPNITAFSALISMLLIVVIYYTYTGILGYNIVLCDLSIFVISLIIGYKIQYHRLEKHKNKTDISWLDYLPGYVILCVLTLLFFVWAFMPPDLNLFRNPN